MVENPLFQNDSLRISPQQAIVSQKNRLYRATNTAYSNQAKSLGQYYLQSLGIMKVTMVYLTPIQQHHLQHICFWFYKYGTGRVQRRIRLRRYNLFTSY